MRANRGLLLLIGVGLLTGCLAGGSSIADVESSPVPSVIPTATESLEREPVGVVPTVTSERATLQVTPRGESRPPAVESLSTPSPVEVARADLARRLHTDVSLIEKTEVTFRAPDPDVMPCIADIGEYEPLFGNLSSVQ